MRVLNVLSTESRVLSSRERCPYLVHLEVAETGLDGSDARLYASGTTSLGATVEESLSMPVSSAGKNKDWQEKVPVYKIPSELIPVSSTTDGTSVAIGDCGKVRMNDNDDVGHDTKDGGGGAMIRYPSRGGWKADEGVYHPFDVFLPEGQYENLREQQIQQAHNQMQQPPPPTASTTGVATDMTGPTSANLSTGTALLDRVFGLSWKTKCEHVRQTSPYGKVKGWRLASFIMKAGEDIRREALVMQLVNMLNQWFETEIDEPMRPKMRPYTIMCVGGDAGLLECLSDAKSVDELKKKTDGYTSLRSFFERAYGKPNTAPGVGVGVGAAAGTRMGSFGVSGVRSATTPPPRTTEDGIVSFEQAQDNFLRSLVGYSLLCYILQIKDRHNANILMDREGHIMHIDFGYVLGDTPKMAKVPIFSERAPFKLSADFWEVLGGWDYRGGGLGVKFCKMFEEAFACAASHVDEIAGTAEAGLLNLTRNARTARFLANGIRNRLTMQGPHGSKQQKEFIMALVNNALRSWGTTTYDWLQQQMNGYQ